MCFCLDLFWILRRAGLGSRLSRGTAFGSALAVDFPDDFWANPLISLITFADLERTAGNKLTK